jgi:hypothetical protein
VLKRKSIVDVASGGSIAVIPFSVQFAITILTMPPSAASSTDSARTCAMSCRRVAPKDRRTAISIVRFAARASSRFAMLAHANSRTIPVMENNMKIGVLASFALGFVRAARQQARVSST